MTTQVFVHRIRKYLGAYMVHLKGNVDAIIMSAGVGENSPAVRSLVLADLKVRTPDPAAGSWAHHVTPWTADLAWVMGLDASYTIVLHSTTWACVIVFC